MGGPAKKRANREREHYDQDSREDRTSSRHEKTSSRHGNGSSSGDTSSSGKALSSARSHRDDKSIRSHRSTASRRAGYDGNRDPQDERDPAKSRLMIENAKNLDLGAVGWGTVHGYDVPSLPPRPSGPSKLGTPTSIGLNTFHVEAVPSKAVYQFEVNIGSGAEKRGLIKRVWASNAVQQALGKSWIFDGNRLAWSLNPIERETRLIVDLDAEDKVTPRNGKENKHRIAIRQTNRVGFDVLMAYLEGKCTFDNTCLEGMSHRNVSHRDGN